MNATRITHWQSNENKRKGFYMFFENLLEALRKKPSRESEHKPEEILGTRENKDEAVKDGVSSERQVDESDALPIRSEAKSHNEKTENNCPEDEHFGVSQTEDQTMTTMKEVIRVLGRNPSAEKHLRAILEKGGKYRVYQKGTFESTIVDGDAVEVAEYLNSLIKEEKEREEESRRKAIINKIAVFFDCHGTETTEAKEFVDYVIQKTHLGNEVYWSAQNDMVTVYHEWAAHSFFDDGGGEEGYEKWTMVFMGKEGEFFVQNEKLNDQSTYALTAKDKFYCRDPFGLNGVFRICFERHREHTD